MIREKDRVSKTIRLGLLLLACTSVTALLTAAGTTRNRPTVAELTSAVPEEEQAHTTVWMVFRAPDCGLSAEMIQQLNRLDESKRVRVVGVMLAPPGDADGRSELASALGMRFEMAFDVDGAWRAALSRDRQREPVMYIRDQRTVLGGVSPEFLHQFDILSLSGVPMERER